MRGDGEFPAKFRKVLSGKFKREVGRLAWCLESEGVIVFVATAPEYLEDARRALGGTIRRIDNATATSAISNR